MITEKRATNIVIDSLVNGTGIPAPQSSEESRLIAVSGRPTWVIPQRPQISASAGMAYVSGTGVAAMSSFSGQDVFMPGSVVAESFVAGSVSYTTGIGQNHLLVGFAGDGSITTGNNCVTIVTSYDNVVAKGSGSIMLAPGPESSSMLSDDAVGIGRAMRVGSGSDGAIAIGSMAGVAAESRGAVALGAWSYSSGHGCLSVGYSGSAVGSGSTQMGMSGAAVGDAAVAIGRSAISSGTSAIAVGYQAMAFDSGSIAVGPNSLARSGSVAFGSGAVAEHPMSCAWGAMAVTTAPRQHAIGKSGSNVIIGSTKVALAVRDYVDDSAASNDVSLQSGCMYRVGTILRIK